MDADSDVNVCDLCDFPLAAGEGYLDEEAERYCAECAVIHVQAENADGNYTVVMVPVAKWNPWVHASADLQVRLVRYFAERGLGGDA